MTCRLAMLTIVGLVLTGCPLLLPSPTEDQIVLCEDSADCPAGFKCVQVGSLSVVVDEYACIQTDPEDSSPPQVELDVDPPVAGVGVEVGFTVDVFDESDLFSPPTLELYPPDDFDGELPGALVLLEPKLIDVDESVSGPDRGFEGYYTYSQLLDADLPQGQWTVEAIVADRAGNTTGQLLVGSFIVDFDPPEVDGVAGLDPTSARADELVSLAVRFNEPVRRGPDTQLFGFVNGEPAGALDIGAFDDSAIVEAVTALPFTTRTPVGVSDGELTFSVTGVVDRAGNVSGELPIEGAVVTLDAELPAVVGGVQVNAARFSSQDGFNQITLVAAFSEPVVDAWARTSSVLANGDTLTFSCDRPDDDLSVACAGTVPSGLTAAPGTPPQTVILYIRAVDAAGNELNEGVEVALDFAPPAIVTSPIELEVEADDDALVPEPSQAGVGTAVELAFLVDEQTGAPPEVTLHAAPPATGTLLTFAPDEQIGLSFVYAAPVEALTAGGQPQPEGPGTLQIVLVDEVGNRATYSAAAELPGGDHVFALDAGDPMVVDVTPPSPPDVATQGRVVYLRAPWGLADTPGARFRVFGTPDEDGLGPVEPNAIVRATIGPVGTAELGRVTSDGQGVFNGNSALSLAPIDRAFIYVQAIDQAGNASSAVRVRDIEWVASMGDKTAGSDLSNPHRFVARRWDDGALSQRDDLEVSGFDGVAPGTPGMLRTTASARWVDRTPEASLAYVGPHSTLHRQPTTGELVAWHSRSVFDVKAVDYRYGGTTWTVAQPIDGSGDGAPGRVEDIAWHPRHEVWVAVEPTGTWVRNDLGWVPVSLATQVAPGDDRCGLAYHEGLDMVVTLDLDRILGFNGSEWVVVDDAVPFAARRYCGLVYDARRARLVLVGGQTIPPGATQQFTMWEHDLEVGWIDAGTFAPPDGPTYVGRYEPGSPVGYDAERGRTWFLDVTIDMNTFLPAGHVLWEWTGDAWIELWALSGPAGGYDPALASTSGGEFVMYGGFFTNLVATPVYVNETWELFEQGVRSPRAQGTVEARHAAAASRDATGGVLFFGGLDEAPEGASPVYTTFYANTLRYVNREMTEVANATDAGVTKPQGRAGGQMAFHQGLGASVLVGGNLDFGAGEGGDVWHFNGSWSKAYDGPHNDVSGPTERDGHALVYDAGRDEVLLYGGYQAGQVVRGDTWAWNGSTWTLLVAEDASGATAPAPRIGARMTYDALRGRVVLFGGKTEVFGQGEVFGDTWVFEDGAWTELSPATSPPPRYEAELVYSPADGRSYLIAGAGAVTRLSDVWSFNGTDWVRDALASPFSEGAPDARRVPAAAYSAAERDIVVWGGRGPLTFDTLHSLQTPHDQRPAHVMRTVFAGAEPPTGSTLLGLDVVGRAGGSGSYGPDCAEADGAHIQVWELDRWVTVARTDGGASQPGEVLATIEGDARLSRIVSAAAARALRVRVLPEAPSGCAQRRGSVTTDTLSTGVRYMLPTPTCGDGIVDDDEVCDGDATCGPQCRPIACGDARREGAEACDDGNLDDGDGCSAACELESAAPVPGDVLITEIMPSAGGGFLDLLREYIEVTNVSGRAINLQGSTLVATGPVDPMDINRPTWLAPGEAIVLARFVDPNANGDLDVRFRLISGLFENFANDAGTMTLSFGGEALDEVSYASATEAVAWQVRPELVTPGADPSVNDDDGAFCASPERYGRYGAYGSPGRLNPSCP